MEKQVFYMLLNYFSLLLMEGFMEKEKIFIFITNIYKLMKYFHLQGLKIFGMKVKRGVKEIME